MPRSDAAPSPAELAKREDAFRIYRDMGPERSYPRLQVACKPKYGEIATRTFSNWAKAHSWKDRLVEYDERMRNAAQVQVEPLDANFDKRKALLEAAHLALMRALQSVPVVTKPQDFKALVDAANNAIKLVEMMDRDRPAGDGAQGAAKKRMFQVLEEIERRIRDAGRNAKLIEGEVVEPNARAVSDAVGEEQRMEPVAPAASTMAERLAARRREGAEPQKPGRVP